MRTLLFGLGLWMFSLSPTIADIRISTLDPGGSVSTYMQYWSRVAQSGEKVIIDAPCMSACTFFLGYIPESRVCITARASLGLHQISIEDQPDPVMSASFYRWLYPEWVQQWIKDQGGLKPDIIVMYPEDMKGHINLCPGETYDPVSPNELIHATPPEEIDVGPSKG